MDSYDERILPDEIYPEDTNAAWMDSRKRDIDYPEEHLSALYSSLDDRVVFHESLSALLSKLFQSLRNTSATESRNIFRELNFVNATNEDPCQKWLDSRDRIEKAFLGKWTHRGSSGKGSDSSIRLQVVCLRCPPARASTPVTFSTTTKFGTRS